MRRMRYFAWRIWIALRNNPRVHQCYCGLPFYGRLCSDRGCWDEIDWQQLGVYEDDWPADEYI